MRFYTKTGDNGTTSLYGGERVPKDDPRISVSGEIDELNAYIGVLAAEVDAATGQRLAEIQARLFLIGSCFSAPSTRGTWTVSNSTRKKNVLFDDSELMRLEAEIDRMQAIVPQLDTFVLPGGCRAAAHAQLCRTVCRRVERSVVSLSRQMPVEAWVLGYLNRLSDYFFVLALNLNFIEGIDEKKLYISCK